MSNTSPVARITSMNQWVDDPLLQAALQDEMVSQRNLSASTTMTELAFESMEYSGRYFF
jgi:hypothetical protein